MSSKVALIGTRYVLAVRDLDRSVGFYENKLGFKTWWAGEGWQFLRRDKCLVMLGECPDDMSAFETNNHSYFAYIDVQNIDQLYQEFLEKDVEVGKLESKPWGQREFALTTIDGHRMMFGQKLDGE